jgi:hypothetical protein
MLISMVSAALATKDSLDLPVRYVTRLFWIFSRLGKLDLVVDSLVPALSATQSHWNCADFARLVQAQPDPCVLPSGLLEEVGARLLSQSLAEDLKQEHPRRQFCFLLAGLARIGMLEVSPLAKVFGKLHDHCGDFSEAEIRRVARAVWSSTQHREKLLEYLPKSWSLVASAAIGSSAQLNQVS